jgi:hypothetical protein
VTVDGDVLAEARQKAQREGLDPNAAEVMSAEVMSADVWATREDGDDDNGVNVYCARCGCHSAVAESSENGTADGCQCACHEDCIARGEG